MDKNVFRYKENTFESLTEDLDIAFNKILNNYRKYIEIEIDSFPYPDDEVNGNYYEVINSEYTLYTLFRGIDETIKNDKEPLFESYKAIAFYLFSFMLNNWEDTYLESLENKELKDSILRLLVNSNELLESFNNMSFNTSNLFSSFTIINYFSMAFSLLCLNGKTYNLQRYLLNRAFSVISLDLIDNNTWEIIDLFKKQDKHSFLKVLDHLFIPHSSKRHVTKSAPSSILCEGVLKAELAYYLFDNWKSISIRRSVGIRSSKFSIGGEDIEGDFELPLQTMGYIAKSKNNYYIAFRGSKTFKNWITNLHQITIGPRIAYMCALGLLIEIRQQISNDQKIIVCGHSLGGGLSQFAVAAATAAGYNNIEAFGYNSAGLSKDTLDRISSISHGNIVYSNIAHICHKSDIVSRIGNQLGDCFLIGKYSKIFSHGIDTIISLLNFTNRLVLITDII